ncbi:MAG: sulfatase-like hydrolase/transferase [Clostridium sp.]
MYQCHDLGFLPAPGEYPSQDNPAETACESMAFDMKNLGYKAHVHNNEATFYDRHKVFAQLGFDMFTPLNTCMTLSGIRLAGVRTRCWWEKLKRCWIPRSEVILYTRFPCRGMENIRLLSITASRSIEMDEFVGQLINMLNTRMEPTVLVLYGDHLPGFEWTAQEMENESLFQTKYVVWNNVNLPAVKRNVEAYQLAAHVLNMLDIHEGTMLRFHQRHLDARDTDTQSYLDAMKLLQYDILYGDHEVYGGESPYQATQLEFERLHRSSRELRCIIRIR